MFNKKAGITGIIAILMIFPSISASNAELWDLIIVADIENAPIISGQSPIVSGVIVDHASKPVELAQVHIRTGQESVFTVTDSQGQFKAVLGNFERIPGMYIVNVVGNSPDGKTGITTTEFQVKGDTSPQAMLEKKLSTPEAIRYLEATVEDFAKDPIGFTLFNYYQGLYQEYLERKAISEHLTEEQLFIEQQKAIAEELRKQAIEEFNPTYGVFSGYKYDDYVKSLDPEIKETIINQLNFTKNLFEEAQLIKQEILNNGGTEEEARQAYLEMITVTKDDLEKFGIEVTQDIDNSTSVEAIPEEIVEEEIVNTIGEETTETLEVDVDGTNIEVEFDGKTIFVNVNGTTIEFLVNSTGVYQVN